MKLETKIKLDDAMEYCDDNDKSIEFMIEYMQNYAGVDHDCVMNYLYKNRDKGEYKIVTLDDKGRVKGEYDE